MRPIIIMTALILSAGAVLAQSAPSQPAEPMDHAAMGYANAAAPAIPQDAAPSTRAYIEAAQKMHQAMAIDYTGDADVDFVNGMIAHHMGAIEMAKIVIKDGKDPQIRAMAEEVIKAQGAEIATMQDWLKVHAD